MVEGLRIGGGVLGLGGSRVKIWGRWFGVGGLNLKVFICDGGLRLGLRVWV